MTEKPKRRKPVELPGDSPILPPQWDIADAAAIQAVHDGRATEEQQRRAIRFIVEGLCATYDLSFRHGPDGERATCVHEGRRFVGLQVVKLTKINLSLLQNKASEHG